MNYLGEFVDLSKCPSGTESKPKCIIEIPNTSTYHEQNVDAVEFDEDLIDRLAIGVLGYLYGAHLPPQLPPCGVVLTRLDCHPAGCCSRFQQMRILCKQTVH